MTDTTQPDHDVLPPATTGIAEFSQTAAALAALRQQLAGKTFNCTNPVGDKEARQSRRLLVELRVALEAKRKELKAPLLERGQLLDAEAKRITAEIVAMEQPIDAVIKAEEARRAAIVAEAERQEAARVASHKAQIDAIRDAPLAYLRLPAKDIHDEIERLKAMDLSLMDEDFRDQAHHTRQLTLGQLVGMHERAVQAEHAAAALAEERAENERIRAQAAEREREQREAREAEVAERERAHAAELAEERRQARLENERLAAEQAERDRVHRDALAAMERNHADTDAREQAQRDEATRVERERLQREGQEAAAQEHADWQQHLATVTLREAAEHAHALLVEQLGALCRPAQELRAALDREAPAPGDAVALAPPKRARKSRAKVKPAVQS